MIDLSLPALTLPNGPSNKISLLQIKQYNILYKVYNHKVQQRQQNMQQISPLALGQCSPAIQDCLESDPLWNAINDASDVIKLLKLIRKYLYKQSTKKNTTHSVIDAAIALYSFHQGSHMSNTKYHDKIMSLVEIYKHLGGEVYGSNTLIEPYLPAYCMVCKPCIQCFS